MKTATLLLLAALTTAAAVAAQDKPAPAADYPPPALEAFISRQGKNAFKPPLSEMATLLGLDATFVLEDGIKSKGVYVETDYLKLVSICPGCKSPPNLYPRVRQSFDVLAKTYPKMKAKYPVLSRVEMAHFIAFHLERVMVDAWRLFGTTRQTYVDYAKSHQLGPYMRQKGKFEAYLFTSESKYNRFADKFTGRTSILGQRYTASTSDALCFLVGPPSGGGKSVNKWVNLTVAQHAHNLLMSEVRNSNRIPKWLDIGFGHWMEQREGFELNTYTFGEAGRQVRFASGDWRPPVRAMIATGKCPELDTFFIEQSLSNYSGLMRGASFGLVDYMIREHLEGFRALLRLLREKELLSLREVFTEAFGTSPAVFYEKWQSWALKAYTPAGLKKMPRDGIPGK